MNTKLCALMAICALLCCAAPCARAELSVTETNRRVIECERMGNHSGAIAAFESIRNTGARENSGVYCTAYPAAALAYDQSGNAPRAYAILETLRNLIARRVGYLQRSPAAMNATLAALADLGPRFADDSCRSLCADMVARAQHVRDAQQ